LRAIDPITNKILPTLAVGVLLIGGWFYTNERSSQAAEGIEAGDLPQLRVSAVTIYPALTSAFHSGKPGWIGADGAYSIKLNPDTTVWTFGDTFIGTETGNKRSPDTKMINNTAAIQKLGGERVAPLSFKWNTQGKNPVSLWVSKEKDSYYWPGDGIAIDGKLFIFLHKIKTDKSRPEPFQFRTVSDVLVRIDNPLENPSRWRMEYVDLKNDAEKIQFATATIRDGKYLNVFCSYPTARKGLEPHPAILARLPLESLQKLDVSTIEYYCRSASDGVPIWSKTLTDPLILFGDAAPEMSVSNVRGLDGFVAVYMPPLSKEIVVRHAEQVCGPWKNRLKLYDCPETEESILLYSAKAHQELATQPGELVVTYCRNARDFTTHFENAAIYYPKAIRARLEWGK
jgi:hypothetical protein